MQKATDHDPQISSSIYRGGGGTQNLRGPNMLPEYICMEKIIILWSDCESRGGGSAPPVPLAQPPLI